MGFAARGIHNPDTSALLWLVGNKFLNDEGGACAIWRQVDITGKAHAQHGPWFYWYKLAESGIHFCFRCLGGGAGYIVHNKLLRARARMNLAPTVGLAGEDEPRPYGLRG